MNKQIEEMGSVIFEVSPIANLWKSDAIKIAEALYKDGYRKTEDIAREFFKEVEKLIRKYNKVPQYDLMFDIYNLKKKYESEGADDGLE